jgi:hypothetical protein
MMENPRARKAPDERKVAISVTLSPEVVDAATARADRYGGSVSSALDYFARNSLPLILKPHVWAAIESMQPEPVIHAMVNEILSEQCGMRGM